MNNETTTDTDPQTGALPNVPTVWPDSITGSALYKYSRQIVRSNWKPLLFLGFLNVAIGGLNNVDTLAKSGVDSTVLIAINVLTFIFGILITAALVVALLDSTDEKPVSVSHSFGMATDAFFKILVAQILTIVIIVFGFILLIIPGIIFAARLSLTNYFIMDKDMGPLEAINASWKATSGNIRKVFQIWSLMILIGLLAITIIGAPFAIYFWFMFSASSAVLYRYLDKNPSPQLTTNTDSSQTA